MVRRFRLLRLIAGSLATPRRALEAIDRGGGGLAAGLLLVLAGTVAFRLDALGSAVRGASPGLGVLTRVLSVFLRELNGAAWIALPAAVAITVLAGRRRDPGVDLELGVACYVPYFAVAAPLRAAASLGASLPAVVTAVARWTGLAAALALVAVAVVQTRRRSLQRSPAPEGTVVNTSASTVPDLPAGWAARAVAGGLALVLMAGAWGGVVSLRRPAIAAGFSLPRADGAGGQLSLAALRGQPVLLDFWATWCPPCLAMLPVMKTLHATWSTRGLSIVGVNSDGPDTDPRVIAEFVAREGIPYAVVVDDGRVAAHYGVSSLPHLVLIGRDGEVKQTFWGTTSAGELERALRRELDGTPR